MCYPVYCEDCEHAAHKEMLQDLWLCLESPVSTSAGSFVRRSSVSFSHFKRCETVNKDGKCSRFLALGNSLEDPQGGG